MTGSMKSGEMYPEYIRLVKSLREEMINQTLDETSTDLYHALYDGVEKTVYKAEIGLFELKWLQKHWDMFVEAIQSADATSSEKEKMFSAAAAAYLEFISKWNYSRLDSIAMAKRMDIFENLIKMDGKWKENLKKLDTLFLRDTNLLEMKIQKIIKEHR